jgi:hypothetical protein
MQKKITPHAGQELWYLLDRRLSGLRSRYRRFEVETNLLSLLVFETSNFRLVVQSLCRLESLSSNCQRRRRLSVQGRILVSFFGITVKFKFFSTRVTIIFNKSVNLDETSQGRIVVPWNIEISEDSVVPGSLQTSCPHCSL